MAELPINDDVAGESSGSALAGSEMVRIAYYSIGYEAEMHAAALNAAGIRTLIFGANTNALGWLYEGFNQVELQVPAADAERAAGILAEASTDELEPAPLPECAAAPVDEQGEPLVRVEAFENVRAMRDAQTILASAGIRAVAPPMMPRGDRPAGVGKRFVLAVATDELDRARSVLADEAREDRDDPRCPRCGSWRVYQHENFFGGLTTLVGLGRGPQAECLACHYRADNAEFVARPRGAEKS